MGIPQGFVNLSIRNTLLYCHVLHNLHTYLRLIEYILEELQNTYPFTLQLRDLDEDALIFEVEQVDYELKRQPCTGWEVVNYTKRGIFRMSVPSFENICQRNYDRGEDNLKWIGHVFGMYHRKYHRSSTF